MASFRYLSAVYRNFVRRLERAVRIADIITQSLMLAYFVFLAYDNFDEPALFYPYIAIIAISLFGLIYTLLTHGRKDPTTKKVNRIVNVGRWAIRGLVLSINLILFFVKGSTDTEKILWAVSVIFLVLQILLDVITREVIHQSSWTRSPWMSMTSMGSSAASCSIPKSKARSPRVRRLPAAGATP